MERRVDLAVARLEADALARSFGLTRKTRFINVLDAAGISKTQKAQASRERCQHGRVVVLPCPQTWAYGHGQRAASRAWRHFDDT